MAYPFHVLNSLSTFVKEVSESQKTLMAKAFHSYSNYDIIRYCISTFMLLCLATFICKVVSFSRRLQKDKQAVFFALFEEKIRPEFRQQAKETHLVTYNAVQSILKENPERPAVLLFLTPHGNMQVAVDYARQLGYCTSKALMKRACSQDMNEVILEGAEYASFDDYWEFHSDVGERVSSHGIVIIQDFQRIHPYVTTALCHLADDTYSPFPKAVIILVADTGDRFNGTETDKMTPMLMAEIFLEEQFGPVLSKNTLTQLLSAVTARSVFIQSEKPHIAEIFAKPSKPLQIAIPNINQFFVDQDDVTISTGSIGHSSTPIIDKEYISSLVLDKQYISSEEPVRDVDSDIISS